MRKPRALALLVCALSLIAAFHCLASPSGGPSASRRAYLILGADRIKGLPFFSPNAIPALSGAYELGAAPTVPGAPTLELWYTRETVVLGPAWKSFGAVGGRAYLLSSGGAGVLALRADRYTLFFRAAEGSLRLDDARAASFVEAFSRKFLSFFENASSDAELSFPAFVDY